MSARLLLLPVALIATTFLPSCVTTASHEAHIAERRQQMLSVYSLGKTTRADVHQKLGKARPTVFERPAKGWAASSNRAAASYGENAEKRSGKILVQAELYHTVDGLFSLCYLWYYYDHKGRLQDVDWEWSSD